MATADGSLTWDNDDSLDNWYNSMTNGTLPPKTTSCYEYVDSELGVQDGIANDWFYSLDHSDKSQSGDVALEATPEPSDVQRWSALQMTMPAGENKYSLNKPLPCDPPSPYFEYLFANAGIKTTINRGKASRNDGDMRQIKISDGKAMFDIERDVHVGNTASTASYSSIAESVTPPTACFNTAYNLLDSTGPVNTEADAVEPSDKVEKHNASVGFYGGFVVEESPSPYHAPNVDDAAGFGDIRDGAEAFPEQWMRKEEPADCYMLAEANGMVENDAKPEGNPPGIGKSFLTPKLREVNAAQENIIQPLPATVAGSNCQHNEAEDHTAQISSTKNSKKRNASDVFATKAGHDTDNSDDEIEYRYTKKIRTDSPIQANTLEAKNTHRPLTDSLITEADIDKLIKASSDATTIFANVEPTSHALNGFPGQYCGLEETRLSSHAMRIRNKTSSPKLAVTFGDSLHANYLYKHTNFTPCATFDSTEYTHAAPIPSEAILFANNQQILAAVTPRTAAEEALRREVHLECTSARLEGCSVGRYRYYQGHMNIEEYRDAGMCICWDICSCSKMCTRYGDLMCPCSDDIQLLEY